jgi:hypothetical protein
VAELDAVWLAAVVTVTLMVRLGTAEAVYVIEEVPAPAVIEPPPEMDQA